MPAVQVLGEPAASSCALRCSKRTLRMFNLMEGVDAFSRKVLFHQGALRRDTPQLPLSIV